MVSTDYAGAPLSPVFGYRITGEEHNEKAERKVV